MTGIDASAREFDLAEGEHFGISMSFDDLVFTIGLFGELDMAGVPTFERALAQAEETSAEVILVDLSRLRFIDSAGLMGLLVANRRSRGGSDRLYFVRGTGQVERTIVLCGLDRRLPFLD